MSVIVAAMNCVKSGHSKAAIIKSKVLESAALYPFQFQGLLGGAAGAVGVAVVNGIVKPKPPTDLPL